MSTISAGTTSNTALKQTGDTTGNLVLQTNGTTTAVTIDTSQNVTLAKNLIMSGSTSGSVTIAAPATAGTQSYTLPTAVPAANGYALTSTTGGVMSWAAAGGSAATPTALGTVYGLMTASGASPYLTAVGYSAGASVTGAGNSALGFAALNGNTSGVDNTSVGMQSMVGNTTGGYNTAVGKQSLRYGTAVSNNTAIGWAALENNTANNNTAVGYQAATACSTAIATTVFGYQALASNTVGNYNTVFGNQAGFSTTGGGNILVGSKAGYGATTALTTGTNCIYIGNDINASSAGVATEFVIGYSATTGKGATTFFVNPNGGASYQGNNSASWSTTSDQRLKKNIVDNNVGLDAINSVRVRNFEYRLPEEVDPELKPTDAIDRQGVQLGVIAQELQTVLPDCVKQESTGVLSVDPDNLTWHMINAIKQLSTALDAANARIAALEAK